MPSGCCRASLLFLARVALDEGVEEPWFTAAKGKEIDPLCDWTEFLATSKVAP